MCTATRSCVHALANAHITFHPNKDLNHAHIAISHPTANPRCLSCCTRLAGPSSGKPLTTSPSSATPSRPIATRSSVYPAGRYPRPCPVALHSSVCLVLGPTFIPLEVATPDVILALPGLQRWLLLLLLPSPNTTDGNSAGGRGSGGAGGAGEKAAGALSDELLPMLLRLLQVVHTHALLRRAAGWRTLQQSLGYTPALHNARPGAPPWHVLWFETPPDHLRCPLPTCCPLHPVPSDHHPPASHAVQVRTHRRRRG